MRKTLAVLLILAAGLVAFNAMGEQWTMEISASTRCIPEKDAKVADATAWTNGISAVAGTYYFNDSGKVYLAVTSGTSTNEPTSSFVFTGTDGQTWMKCATFRAHAVRVCVLSGDEVHYNRYSAATTNCPWLVKETLEVSSTTDFFFVPNTGTSTLSFITE